MRRHHLRPLALATRPRSFAAAARACCGCALLLLTLAPQLLAQAAPRGSETCGPPVPLTSSFWNYWDHYWTTWLPDHPVYEMIEATVYEGDGEQEPLIRVILSEREGDSRQYFYLNQADAAERSRADSYHVPMEYRRTGVDGSPQNLELSFRDGQGRRIAWSLQFGGSVQMKENLDDLTESSHSIGGVLLFAHASRSAPTYDDSVLIDGRDWAHAGPNDDGVPRIRSWYNSDYKSAVLVFGVQRYTNSCEELTNSWGATFTQRSDDPRVWRSNELGPENFIELHTDPSGALTDYLHFSHGRALKFSFDPALPGMAALEDGQQFDFSGGFGPRTPRMSGTIVAMTGSGAAALEWQPESPDWAVDRPFWSVIQETEDGFILLVTDDRSRVYGDGQRGDAGPPGSGPL